MNHGIEEYWAAMNPYQKEMITYSPKDVAISIGDHKIVPGAIWLDEPGQAEPPRRVYSVECTVKLQNPEQLNKLFDLKKEPMKYSFSTNDSGFDGDRILRENPGAEFICVTYRGRTRTLFTEAYAQRITKARKGFAFQDNGPIGKCLTFGILREGVLSVVTGDDGPYRRSSLDAWRYSDHMQLLDYEAHNAKHEVTVESGGQ